MNKEEIENIQEMVERRLMIGQVSGCLSSFDIKMINAWEYTMELMEKQERVIKELEKYKELKDNQDFVALSSMYEFIIDNSLEILKGEKDG